MNINRNMAAKALIFTMLAVGGAGTATATTNKETTGFAKSTSSLSTPCTTDKTVTPTAGMTGVSGSPTTQ